MMTIKPNHFQIFKLRQIGHRATFNYSSEILDSSDSSEKLIGT
jgi:hypothetical protein